MASVTDSRPLRELIAEAKAEVTEVLEDSKEEEEEEEADTPAVGHFIVYGFKFPLQQLIVFLSRSELECKSKTKRFKFIQKN